MAGRRLQYGDSRVKVAGKTLQFLRSEVHGPGIVYGVWDHDADDWHDGPWPLRRLALARWHAIILGTYKPREATHAAG